MVNPAKRHSKKVTRRSPSGKRVVLYGAKKPSAASCALCGGKLQAVPRRSASGMRALAKTEKRPQRVFGGVLCFGCTSKVLKERARLSSGSLTRAEVDFTHLPYISMLRNQDAAKAK